MYHQGEEYVEFIDWFLIPFSYDPILCGSDHTALDASPVDCRAYGGEPTLFLFRSLFTLSLFSDQYPGLVTSFRHYPSTLSFPYPTEPFDASLQSCLLRYAIEFWTFLELILYLAGLTCSWEGSPLHPTIMIDGRGNHPVSVAVVPAGAPFLSSKGKEIMGSSASGSKRKRLGFSGDRAPSFVFVGRRTGFICPLASSEKGKDADLFLPGDDEAQESHDILSGLCHPKAQRRLDGLSLNELANFHYVSALKIMIASTMLNREAPSLSTEVLRLFNKVFDLKSQRSESTATIPRLKAKLLGVKDKSSVGEAALVHDLKVENEKLVRDIADLQELSHLVESSKKILESDIVSLRGRCRQFEENEATMLASEASLKAELELEGVKDYDPDTVEVYDKAIDNFNHVEFPYLGLLAYHSKRSLGLLKSLVPPSVPLYKSSGVALARGFASIHLVKRSIAVARNFIFPEASDNGPIMPMLHFANGQAAMTEVKSCLDSREAGLTALMHSLEAARYTTRLLPALGATRCGKMFCARLPLPFVFGGRICMRLEQIINKRTKNEAKSTKPDSEWKSKEKSKSKSKPKSTEVNPTSRKNLSLKSESESTFQSISGNKYQSFGQAFLMFVKSTHSPCSVCLLNHDGVGYPCLISCFSEDSGFFSSSTSLEAAALRSGAIPLFFCCTGVIFFSLFSLCSVTKISLYIFSVLGIPIISEYSHVNISALLLSNFTNFCLNCVGSCLLIITVYSGYLWLTITFSSGYMHLKTSSGASESNSFSLFTCSHLLISRYSDMMTLGPFSDWIPGVRSGLLLMLFKMRQEPLLQALGFREHLGIPLETGFSSAFLFLVSERLTAEVMFKIGFMGVVSCGLPSASLSSPLMDTFADIMSVGDEGVVSVSITMML
ncbi:hypothetical protein Tco_0705416 [Tanacetum coccineum]|uniref:Uncharacterized protein n=1 Tax=Tanacetum coccineum TaxID=301880 RepID=A0ABQ4Y5D7_9ASTR